MHTHPYETSPPHLTFYLRMMNGGCEGFCQRQCCQFSPSMAFKFEQIFFWTFNSSSQTLSTQPAGLSTKARSILSLAHTCNDTCTYSSGVDRLAHVCLVAFPMLMMQGSNNKITFFFLPLTVKMRFSDIWFASKYCTKISLSDTIPESVTWYRWFSGILQ